MPNQLKPDELFVISALADHLSGTWSAGEDPPDAYLKIGEGTVAVEISTLTQHVVDERGGTHARLSEDSTALWLANELDKELCKTADCSVAWAYPSRRVVLASECRNPLQPQLAGYLDNIIPPSIAMILYCAAPQWRP